MTVENQTRYLLSKLLFNRKLQSNVLKSNFKTSSSLAKKELNVLVKIDTKNFSIILNSNPNKPIERDFINLDPEKIDKRWTMSQSIF